MQHIKNDLKNNLPHVIEHYEKTWLVLTDQNDMIKMWRSSIFDYTPINIVTFDITFLMLKPFALSIGENRTVFSGSIDEHMVHCHYGIHKPGDNPIVFMFTLKQNLHRLYES